ncbi:hypothetical protein OA7_0017870 [Vibrio cyclitrophicus 1F53]|uniref:hypothetical protein n=2 Tax=Vibrio cyclitrophicus TaxID=47951 RepID=UPI0002EC4DB3|nr:hypothetical protein [Vibrio cyclitrophicus]OEF37191.1 hypothetical protein OA7_03805 [Vibrio cyclitrophicus 1F53]OEF66964.1 hypothetical protein OAA_07795 [Vibrio cyclitrophicus 1F175]PMH35518.1 hypothetical protein BCU72_10470 [Vibrio cyclitrophicus]
MSAFEKMKSNQLESLKVLQIKFSADYDEEVIDAMYYAALSAKSNLEQYLSKKVEEVESDEELSENEKYFIIDTYSDDHYLSRQTVELAEEMQIVALYKSVEISIKDMLKYSGLFTNKQLDSFYRIGALKKEVSKKVCALDGLKNYKSYDELRCINNCIKHSGRVNKELSKFSGWNVGDKIVKTNDHYTRLKDDVRGFVFNLRDELLSKIV